MDLLIYLLVFVAVFILTKFFVDAVVPALMGKYNKWQQKRLNKVAGKLEDSFIFLEKNKMTFLSVSPLVFSGVGFIIFRNIALNPSQPPLVRGGERRDASPPAKEGFGGGLCGRISIKRRILILRVF